MPSNDQKAAAPNNALPFNTIEDALIAIRDGRFVVVLDDEDRENEGDLIIAAEHMTTEAMAFLVRHSSGVVCVALEAERCRALNLEQMVTENSESMRTAFTVSVDYRHGTHTGISAADRALTIRALAAPESRAEDFLRPGHIFPLQARAGGVLKRDGHTEAALDLARLAGLQPAGVLCELVNPLDGSMLRGAALHAFARQHRLPIITIAALREWRRCHENQLRLVAESTLATRYGEFRSQVYRSAIDGIEHLVLQAGDCSGEEEVLCRIHSECLTGDVFGSARCDCGSQLDAALQEISQRGRGVLIYLRGHEGRGIGLAGKIQAYALQECGLDTVDANIALGLPVDGRHFADAAHLLHALNVKSVRLLTNNPAKIAALEASGIRVLRSAATGKLTPHNWFYVRTKQERLGHLPELERM